MPKASRPRPAPAPAAAPVVPSDTGPGTGTAALLYFGLALLYFLPAFLPGQHIYGTDYYAGGYFFYHFVSERLAAGELPKWVPYIFGGLPLFANPGSSYQPVHFLADLLLPTSRVLAAVFVAHFAFAGFGMYLLARELGTRPWIAALAGLAFQFTGILLSWVYAGHDGRIIVATLAPLFFFFLHRGVRTGGLAPFAGAAATLGMALLSFQIQNSYYLLLAAAIWAVFCLFQLGAARDPRRLARVVALGLGAVAFGFVLAATNFLPFLDYIPESPRGAEGGRGYEYSTSYSMPPAELLSLAVPEQHGVSVGDPETGEPLFPAYEGANPFKLHTEYAGAFVIVLLALGAWYARRDRYWWFFAALAAFMLTIALGGNTPLYRLYYAVLPGTKQFRAPSLSFFVVALALVTMAALALEHIARLRVEARERRGGEGAGEALGRAVWIVAGVIGFALLGLLLSSGQESAAGAPTAAQGWGRFLLFAAAVGGLLLLWLRDRMTTVAFAVLLGVVTTADLWLIGRRFFHTLPPAEVTFAPDDVIAFLERQPEPYRIWTFPIPQPYRGAGTYGGDYPMLFGIDQVGGEHPNMLQRWNEYVGAGTETYIDWHNLITGAGVVNTPEGQAIAFRSEEGFLDAANIRYVVSMAPLAHPSLREVHRGSALVYENVGALPRAYLVPEAVVAPPEEMVEAMRSGEWDPRRTAFVAEPVELGAGPLQGAAEVVTYEPDRVVVRARADRPALLVLADNYLEGWEATIDGSEAEVLLVNHTFRGVVLPEGEHTVEFVFAPDDLYTGLYVTVAAFALLIGYAAWLLLRRRRERGEADAG